MKVEQIYSIMNTVTNELLGDSVVVNEDLSNIVELGDTFLNTVGVDNYVKSLTDHIGRVIFVDRVYNGRLPQVLRDGWEYGSILEKVATKLPEAVENETWELENGQSYDPFIFHSPEVVTKFYNQRVTFEIDMSFTEKQVKSSFSNVTQLNAFLSMIRTSIENSMTVKTDGLIMRTINNMIAETLYDEYSGGVYTGGSGVRAVNLLYLYNQTVSAGDALTASEFMTSPAAIRFSISIFKNYIDRLRVMSTRFNVGGQERFTPTDRLNVVMLSEFKNAADVFLQSGTFNDQYTALPESETVVYWQGSGLDYGFASTSKIDITTPDNHTVTTTGILGVMFDRDALGVSNLDKRVTSQYNAKAEFFNEFWKFECGAFNDLNENFVVFFVA